MSGTVLRNTRMAIAILAQGNRLELKRAASYCCMHHSICMQEEQQKEEQDPLFYDLPLPRLLAWTHWWHITAKTIVLVCKKRAWGVIGPHLKSKKGAVGDRIARLRTEWSARGRELDYIKHSI